MSEAQSVLVPAVLGAGVGAAVGGVPGLVAGGLIGAGIGELAYQASGPHSYMYVGGPWGNPNPTLFLEQGKSLEEFEKCMTAMAAQYREWKVAYEAAVVKYYQCLVKIDQMLCAWRSRCYLSPCDRVMLDRVIAEGNMRHERLKQLLCMARKICEMKMQCEKCVCVLRGMTAKAQELLACPCDLTMIAH